MDGTPIQKALAGVAVAAISLQLVALAALHGLSPEFDPAWRMVSEYALGSFAGVLALMFVAWSVGTLALAIALVPVKTGATGKATTAQWVGWVLLVLSGIGSGSAAYFDIRNDLHALTALFGIGSLPVAALLLNRRLARPVGFFAHLPWLGVVVMAVAMGVLMGTYAASGAPPNQAPQALPAGVVGLNGWANRLLILAFDAWTVAAAFTVLRESRPRG